MRGEWKLCQNVELYPDKEGISRKFKVTLTPTGRSYGSYEINEKIGTIRGGMDINKVGFSSLPLLKLIPQQV